MTSPGDPTVRLEFSSDFEMVEFVQVVSDHISRGIGLTDDALHWVNVAVRESVVNAIKHGNRQDPRKRVFVEFAAVRHPAGNGGNELVIKVRDEGEGFDPLALPDPLAPENLLSACGRGIFLMRHFMDDVQIERAPEGGMQIRLTKRVT